VKIAANQEKERGEEKSCSVPLGTRETKKKVPDPTGGGNSKDIAFGSITGIMTPPYYPRISHIFSENNTETFSRKI